MKNSRTLLVFCFGLILAVISPGAWGEEQENQVSRTESGKDDDFGTALEKEAFSFSFDELKTKRKKLGNDHPDVAAVLYHIGMMYEKKGRYKDALKYHMEA